ncbi:STAS domain-containing protein [Domibacillus sp. DTU_2020_1001157_1_SI_ALB_TIR_016]|uniref:STAS domain-containing protein n=1 Tax=Domibacillus sp. DTU_2020_1001157_1_SI_ALB_TIR_016 TaxID=3077789 RepID=UPI0028EC839A|nr:STAS domain-containing protein [Domibacillus sp. DTU_2020_1001157_1_SI_ALB_TIR_016]WNS78118.1 STAS domain-containing protein [Domibacillus sp. DTU_2020_1001157_1_SI_ALB_TIR_016]
MEISIEISRKLNQRYTSFLNESGLADDAIAKWRAQLIHFIGTAILDQNDASVTDSVADWSVQTAEGAVNYGVGIDDLMLTVRCYRGVIWDYIEKEIDIEAMNPFSVLKVNRIIDAILDQTAQVFSVSYVEYHTKAIRAAQKAFNEVSFPVVALSDQVAVLPLIGELSEERASILLENVLPKCKDLKINDLILDLSGVPQVDTMGTDKLFQLKQSLSLIGINLIFTGIKPSLALPMVNLGVSLDQLNVKGTLKNAISAYKLMQ